MPAPLSLHDDLLAPGLDVPLVHSRSDIETSESESDAPGRAAPQRSLRPRGSQPRAAAQQGESASVSPRSRGLSGDVDDFGMTAAAVLLGASRGDAVGGTVRASGGAGGRNPAAHRRTAGWPDSKHASSDRCVPSVMLCRMSDQMLILALRFRHMRLLVLLGVAVSNLQIVRQSITKTIIPTPTPYLTSLYPDQLQLVDSVRKRAAPKRPRGR